MSREKQKQQKERALFSPQSQKKLILFAFIILGLILFVNITYVYFSLHYRVVWIRSGGLEVEDRYEILIIGLGLEVKDPSDPDTIWYYSTYGGAVNKEAFEQNATSNDITEAWFQRILVEWKFTQIYVFFVLNDTTTGEFIFLSKKVDLFDSTEIIIRDLDIADESIDIKVTELNYFVEVVFNVI